MMYWENPKSTKFSCGHKFWTKFCPHDIFFSLIWCSLFPLSTNWEHPKSIKLSCMHKCWTKFGPNDTICSLICNSLFPLHTNYSINLVVLNKFLMNFELCILQMWVLLVWVIHDSLHIWPIFHWIDFLNFESISLFQKQDCEQNLLTQIIYLDLLWSLE